MQTCKPTGPETERNPSLRALAGGRDRHTAHPVLWAFPTRAAQSWTERRGNGALIYATSKRQASSASPTKKRYCSKMQLEAQRPSLFEHMARSSESVLSQLLDSDFTLSLDTGMATGAGAGLPRLPLPVASTVQSPGQAALGPDGSGFRVYNRKPKWGRPEVKRKGWFGGPSALPS